MTILNQWSTEREGNDAWLRYQLIAYRDWDDVYLEICENHSGWNGPYTANRQIKLDLSNMTEVIDQVTDYITEFADDTAMGEQVLEELVLTLHQVNHMLASYVEARVKIN